jgi:23S rRNA pseudoU1915 N3-methylase RlmH
MKENATTVSRAIKEQASEFAGDVGHELKKTAEEQKARGVEAIQCFARAMTGAAAELEKQSPQVAEYVRDAAQKIVGLSEKIGQRDVAELARAAQELARSQPLLLIGGAVATGFAVSRFFMSAKSLPDQHPPKTAAHT